MTSLRVFLFIGLILFGGNNVAFAVDIIQTLLHTTFDENVEHNDWHAERNCRAIIKGQLLHIEALNGLPEISQPVDFTGGEFRLIVELRTTTESQASLYWMSLASRRRSEDNKVTLPLHENGQWYSYEFVFAVPDVLQSMAIRFSTSEGSWEIRSVRLIRKSLPPFSVRDSVPHVLKDESGQEREGIKFVVANELLVPMRYRPNKEPILPGRTEDLWLPVKTEGNLASVVLTLRPDDVRTSHAQDFPTMAVPIFLYYPNGQTDWIEKPIGTHKSLEIAPDGRMARLRQNGELFGIIAPLVHRNGAIPKFVLADDSTDTDLHFESDEVDLQINIAVPFLHFEINDKMPQNEETVPLEGPVVRLFGKFRSGLLPGVEFLKAGDVSSSEVDIERPYNNRSLPNPLWITMPFAVLETDKGGAVLYWDDASLQPTFSAPNLFDHTEDHRFSLIGSHIKGSLELLFATQPTEEDATFRVLRSYVAQKGFPPPPPALRTVKEQNQLSMQALHGALQSEMGGQWGYAYEPEWDRESFVDTLSTLARLTEAAGGRMKNPTILVPGGSDITNDTIFFLSGRIPEWQRNREAAIRQIMAAVNADGSFLYRTRFPELETAASSFGYTAWRALAIMEYARATGNNELFAVVTKALGFLEQCKIPSGGFYQDTPFHTPDLQAAAWLVWLYVWAYEYSGNDDYLERAKHFAFAGLPFVYQTSQKEHMLYGAVGKFGGTGRRLPLHFGIMNIRVGIQYAYALTLLSKYDDQTDWKMVARGILYAVENLQYTEGTEAGCIPESFDIISQERFGWKVNPCALVSLRWAIEGKVDSLFVLRDGRDRYTAPYPLRKTPKGIESFDVPPGQKFHILHNARRYGTGEGNGMITVD